MCFNSTILDVGLSLPLSFPLRSASEQSEWIHAYFTMYNFVIYAVMVKLIVQTLHFVNEQG